MLDIILLIMLIIGAIAGLRRGFILKLLHLISFIAAFLIARQFYDDLAPQVRLWIPYPDFGEGQEALAFFSGNMESSYYNAISFVIIFILAVIALRIIASMLDFVAMLPVLKQVNKLLGGVLGFLEVYLFLFVFLFIAALIPAPQIQDALQGSSLSNLIINHTPYLSELINTLWLQYGGVTSLR
ncbi:CvpA family protein [Bacillus gobiensis]|uniref:CvpA family protein n=1 Tax=Bacillus gobiensis TaxID=1441095 RepID=UPI003D1FF286